jgi:hypothetical protein
MSSEGTLGLKYYYQDKGQWIGPVLLAEEINRAPSICLLAPVSLQEWIFITLSNFEKYLDWKHYPG